MKRLYAVFFLVCMTVFFGSCSDRNKTVVLDDSEPLALAPDVSWAVVIDPYAAYRKDTVWDAEVIGHSRKGDILQVLGKSVVNSSENWYKFKAGWLPGSSVNIYNNRLRAQTAAEQLIE